MSADHSELVLAVRPFARGFAFALFEAPLAPVDWGVRIIRGGDWNARCLAAIQTLIVRNQPDVLAMEDPAAAPARRSRKIHRLHRLIANEAVGQGVEVRRFTRADIRACFKGVGAQSRYEIAQSIAAQVHAFGYRLPPMRKLWESEDPRMFLFDAASLVMTYFAALCPQASHEEQR